MSALLSSPAMSSPFGVHHRWRHRCSDSDSVYHCLRIHGVHKERRQVGGVHEHIALIDF
jgi:hypothetical protein